MPPPGNFSKGINVSKFREILKSGKEATVLAEELGFTAREISHLEKAGMLEETVLTKYEQLMRNPATAESIELFKNAEKLLASYKGKYLSESFIKARLQEAGINTFPRPSSIPENFRVKLGKKFGIVYVHPENSHMSVRVMPGKPHSPFPYQQKPYIVHKMEGKTLNKFGKQVSPQSPEAHIPLSEFIYREH